MTPTADLLARLRKVEPDGGDAHSTRWYRNPDGPEAADRIERLEAQLAEANKALVALGTAPSPVQRLGAAISRRDWHEVEQAHAAIRDIVDAARRTREAQGGE